MRVKTISVAIPVRNEQANILSLVDCLVECERDLASLNCALEVVFTDNASTDGSWTMLKHELPRLKTARAFRFVRNYGFQESILFGISRARGDLVVVLQSDLQDPPDLVVDFVDAWLKGSLTIAGKPQRRQDPMITTIARALFYRLLQMTSDHAIVLGVPDFFALDATVVRDIHTNKPSSQLLRTYISEHFGFETIIPYERKSRFAGKPSLSLRHYYSLALDGLLLSGSRAARNLTLIACLLGGAACLVFMCLLAAYTIGWRPAAVGWASLTLLLLLNIAVTGLGFGLAFEYLLRLSRFNTCRVQPVLRDEISKPPS